MAGHSERETDRPRVPTDLIIGLEQTLITREVATTALMCGATIRNQTLSEGPPRGRRVVGRRHSKIYDLRVGSAKVKSEKYDLPKKEGLETLKG